MTTWHRAIAFALTGADLDLAAPGVPDVAMLSAQLTASGWDAEAIGVHAREVVASGQPWPHPVPDALRAGLGAAQLHAAIGRLRHQLGLDVLTVMPPSRRTRLDADERRLLADVPPHFGRS